MILKLTLSPVYYRDSKMAGRTVYVNSEKIVTMHQYDEWTSLDLGSEGIYVSNMASWIADTINTLAIERGKQ